MAELLIDVKTTGVNKIDQLNSKVKNLEGTNTRTAKSFNILQVAATAAVTAGMVKKIINYSDSWKNVEGRLRLVTESTSDLVKTQKELFTLAQNSRQSFEATANLYTRMAKASKSLGTSQEDLLKATDAINKSMVVSGASSQEAQSAVTQLSQGLASGVLRGEEFNTIMESGSRVAQALSDSLGVTSGELRAMAQEGKLTSDVVMKALVEQGEKINAEFERMPLTISQAMQSFDNSMGKIVARAESGTGAMSNLATSIQWVGEAFEEADQFWFGDAKVDSQTRWIEENEKFIQQLKEEQGLIPDVAKLENNLIDIRFKAAEALGVTFESLSSLTQAELENARAVAEETAVLDILEQQSRENEAADLAYYDAQIKLLDVSQAITEANTSEVDSIIQKTEAVQALAQATIEATTGLGYFDEGYTYTVSSPTENNFWSIWSESVDESTTIVDSFNTTINTTDDALKDFESTLSSIDSALSGGMSSLSAVFGQTAQTYGGSYQAALSARSALISDPLSPEASESFATAYSQFQTASSAYTGDASRFKSAEQQRFAQATAGQQSLLLQDTALLTYDVQEETKNLMASIDAAIADGILTDEEKATIANVASDVNDSNNLLLGSSGIVADRLDVMNTSVNGQTYYDNTGLATDTNMDLQDYYNNTGLATGTDIENQTYYDNTGLALNTSLIGTDGVISEIQAQEYYNNLGLATNANMDLQTYYDNSLLALDSSLTGETNSVTDALSSLNLESGDVTIDMESVATAVDGFSTAVGNEGLAGEVSNVYSALGGTSSSGTGLDDIKIKTMTTTNQNTYAEVPAGWNVITGTYDAAYTDYGTITGSTSTINYGYKQGGFTNKGESNTQAGVVHAGEWVAPKWMVDSNSELFRNLDNARQSNGFQRGGSTTTASSGSKSVNKEQIKMNQYLFVLTDEMKKLHSLLRRVTEGGDRMRTELVA